MRAVAVTMCEEPAVREVKRYRVGSSSQEERSWMERAGEEVDILEMGLHELYCGCSRCC